ncbi:MAG: metallophosphoesterase [Syntrophaceae bacterium]
MHAFVADVHLRPGDAGDASRFVSWLTGITNDTEAVYILGDLFDYWYTGIEDRFQDVLHALRSPKVHLMRGNRDFLLKNLSSPVIQVIPSEETIIHVGDTRVLLAHGHTLTRADIGFRLLHSCGWPALEHLDRVLPKRLKLRLARFLVSSSATIRPSRAVIREGVAAHAGVDTVICGHLHRSINRPGLIVLPAFFDTGGWLSWDASGPKLQYFPDEGRITPKA